MYSYRVAELVGKKGKEYFTLIMCALHGKFGYCEKMACTHTHTDTKAAGSTFNMELLYKDDTDEADIIAQNVDCILLCGHGHSERRCNQQ